MIFLKRLFAVALVGAVLLPVSAPQAIADEANVQEVNVYSARKEALIKPILDKFTQQTNIKVNLVTGKADALISRLSSEGKLSPADLLITTDVGRLHRAKSQGLLQPSNSAIMQSVPAQLRDPEHHWFGLTLRARPIMYVPSRVKASELSTMENLTDPKWRGRICIRSSGNIYNQSMVAAMLAQQDKSTVQSWAEGLVSNFARPPKGGDRDQIKAAVAGICDIAIANTYYLAGMLSDTDKKNQAIAKQIKVFWPNQNTGGAHVNISGAAITKNAPNKTNAEKLLAFMVTPEAQEWYAQTNHEYPVMKGVKWSPVLQGFGQFKSEQVDLQKVGELNTQAVQLMDRAGWK